MTTPRTPAGGHPPCPAQARVQAVCDWLASLERRQVRGVTLAKISRDLWPILRPDPAPGQPPGHSPDPCHTAQAPPPPT
jgi:hypothetical protein